MSSANDPLEFLHDDQRPICRFTRLALRRVAGQCGD